MDAGIQDIITSISIEFNVEKRLLKEMVMKVTNIHKHDIVQGVSVHTSKKYKLIMSTMIKI